MRHPWHDLTRRRSSYPRHPTFHLQRPRYSCLQPHPCPRSVRYRRWMGSLRRRTHPGRPSRYLLSSCHPARPWKNLPCRPTRHRRVTFPIRRHHPPGRRRREAQQSRCRSRHHNSRRRRTESTIQAYETTPCLSFGPRSFPWRVRGGNWVVTFQRT
jgi:hypothetical protein